MSSKETTLKDAKGVEPGCVEIIPRNLVTLHDLVWLYSEQTIIYMEGCLINTSSYQLFKKLEGEAQMLGLRFASCTSGYKMIICRKYSQNNNRLQLTKTGKQNLHKIY